MDSITFSEIMEFYPKHNRSVYEELKNACQHRSIIPFVGAGMSVFCGYQGWPDVLKELAGYVYDPGMRANIETMIEDGELLQAAEEIKKKYPLMLKVLQKLIDYDKIKNCNHDKLYASAAYVLPYLFNSNMVMTTNFDRVLEEVYDRCRAKFGKVITPYEPDLLTQSRQNNPHCLFKLHGDIGPEIHDIELDIRKNTQQAKKLLSKHPKNTEIQLLYAETLFNLTLVQESEALSQTVGYSDIGVVFKVLLIQLLPRILRADMDKERALIALPQTSAAVEEVNCHRLDTWGLFPFAITVALGILLGAVTISLPGGGSFSLGTTGGPLIVGLFMGHIGHIGKLDLRPDPKVYGSAKEIGLMLFFSGAGVEGGHGLVEILSFYGIPLLIYAFILN